MNRLSMLSMNKPMVIASDQRERSNLGDCFVAALLVMTAILSFSNAVLAAEAERDPVTLSIVAVNPSSDKVQVVPVRIDLPVEVTPSDVLDSGELKLEYDDNRSIYYVQKKDLQLRPKETRVFSVKMRDLWFVPEGQLKDLKEYTHVLLGKLKKTEYFESAQRLAKTIIDRLESIAATQKDETLSRKSRIGAYRRHVQMIEQIKEDLNRLEKLLAFTGGPPVPNMLEESPLKSDAPSTTTTWLVIFLVVVFVALLGGQFFFTWHSRTKKGPVGDLSVYKSATHTVSSAESPAAGQKAKNQGKAA